MLKYFVSANAAFCIYGLNKIIENNRKVRWDGIVDWIPKRGIVIIFYFPHLLLFEQTIYVVVYFCTKFKNAQLFKVPHHELFCHIDDDLLAFPWLTKRNVDFDSPLKTKSLETFSTTILKYILHYILLYITRDVDCCK